MHVFNLGTGTGYSVREVVDAARQVTGLAIPVIMEPRRAGDSAILVADATKVREALNWQPRATLNDQVRDAWQWVKILNR
jgi:UDP-glucose 4-epimerase